MTTDETIPPDRESMVKDLGQQALSFAVLTSEDLARVLGHFARLQGERAIHLRDAEFRLERHAGEQDARVSALNEAAETAKALERSLRRAADQEIRRPIPVAGEWIVHGRVLDPEGGRPVPDVRVQVLDDDPLWDDLVGRTRTDEYGYFGVVYEHEEFSRLFGLERKPDLYVTVRDREGNQLYRTPPREIRRDADRIEYFHIVLDRSLPSPSVEATSTRPPLEDLGAAPPEPRRNILRDIRNRLFGD